MFSNYVACNLKLFLSGHIKFRAQNNVEEGHVAKQSVKPKHETSIYRINFAKHVIQSTQLDENPAQQMAL